MSADREEKVREALELADKALMDARNGLDLGLGCARDLEGDESPVPGAGTRARQQDAYLQRARSAHRKIKAALSALDGEGRQGTDGCCCGNGEAEDDRSAVLRCPVHGPGSKGRNG